MITFLPTILDFSIYFQPVYISCGTRGWMLSLRNYFPVPYRIVWVLLYLVFDWTNFLMVEATSPRPIVCGSRTPDGRWAVRYGCVIGGVS
jgi:hypothetical protein